MDVARFSRRLPPRAVIVFNVPNRGLDHLLPRSNQRSLAAQPPFDPDFNSRSRGLIRRGFVAADNLQSWKARILPALALAKTNDTDDIQRVFDTY
jgi:hypothetical protein